MATPLGIAVSPPSEYVAELNVVKFLMLAVQLLTPQTLW